MIEFLHTLHTDTTVLTPNQRLSAILMKHYQQQCIQQGKISWQTPNILPLQSWLQRLWQEYTQYHIDHHPLLLTPSQELATWEKILSESSTGKNLLQITRTAETARKAWGLLKLWGLDIGREEFNLTDDSQAFQTWAEIFQQQLNHNHWIDTASLPDVIVEKAQQYNIQLPKKIILYGFTEVSPQHQKIFNLIPEISLQSIEQSQSSIYKTILPDDESEIRTMAAWAKSIHEKNEKCFIGCVIPTLEHIRDQVIRIFCDTFTAHDKTTLEYFHLPFNISAGRSLASLPLIQAALQLLRFDGRYFSEELLQTLLFSPFVAHAEREKFSRAEFAMALREANIKNLTLEQLSRCYRKCDLEKSCPKLWETIQNLASHIDSKQHQMTMHDWARYFATQLQAWGWPGERSLNSEEYQITQQWIDALLTLSSLDSIVTVSTQQEALKQLTQLVENSIFQPKTPDAPIQISGIFEAASMPFTHLWVMGLDDTQWPFPARPNPFIPIRLQKKYKMPHASAERELEYCQTLFDQLKNSAQHVIFSYANQRDDEILRPAIFLENIEMKNADVFPKIKAHEKEIHIHATQRLESIQDENAPVVAPTEKIHGGTRIFKQQAACPFRAFVEIRLNVYSAPSPSIGLRPLDRGNIIHKALEYFWRKIQSSQTLNSFTEETLQSFIDECIQNAILFCTERDTKRERYLQLEAKRLSRLLIRFITLEKSRPEFTVIACEKELQTTIGQIPVKLRIDRIDQLHNQSQMIIDYKTGKNISIQNWLGDRPDEPQLPLYCLSGDENITTIAFAKLTAEMVGYIGLSREEDSINGIQSLTTLSKGMLTWEEQRASWQRTLTHLADQFYAGIATIDPKHGSQTCQTCQLQSLCRIHERAQ